MKAAEIREMSIEEVKAEIESTREALMRLRFRSTTGELEDHTQLRSTRRNIARLLTILHELQQNAEKEGEA